MRVSPVAIGLLFLLVACGSGPECATEPLAELALDPDVRGEPPAPATGAGCRSCENVVAAFREAGLADLTRMWLVETRYFAREDQIETADPCNEARRRRTSTSSNPAGGA